MRKILFIITIFFISQTNSFSNEIVHIIDGNKDAKINLIIYESLTCPSCAKFHKDIYPKLKKEFIDKGIVNIEFKNFPLDLAALNASKLAHCMNDGDSKILHYLYYNQKSWAKGKNILEVNNNLKKTLENSNFKINFEECINNKKIEDFVLEERIDGHKKYKIEGTPTLIINGEKFDKTINFKNIKKIIKKMI